MWLYYTDFFYTSHVCCWRCVLSVCKGLKGRTTARHYDSQLQNTQFIKIYITRNRSTQYTTTKEKGIMENWRARFSHRNKFSVKYTLDNVFRSRMISHQASMCYKKAVLSQRRPRDARYISGSNEPLRRYGHSKLSMMAAVRQLGFDVTGNSAIRSADPENPTLEPNMKCIGSPVAEIWPIAYLGGIWNSHFGGKGRS